MNNDLKTVLILIFFGFIGGLTRELNDIVNSKLRLKSFVLGLITASLTGTIISQILLEYKIGFHMACFITAISGFMGPYVLLSISKLVKRKLEIMEEKLIKEEKNNDIE